MIQVPNDSCLDYPRCKRQAAPMGEECRLCPNSHRDGNCDHDSAQRHGWDI